MNTAASLMLRRMAGLAVLVSSLALGQGSQQQPAKPVPNAASSSEALNAPSASQGQNATSSSQAQNAPGNTKKLPDAPAPRPDARATTPTPAQDQPTPAPAPLPATGPPPTSNEPPATVQPYQGPGQAENPNAPDQLYRIMVTTNAVVVPVVVKDHDGNLVQDLDKKDFTLLENGVRQNINYFSSEPFPISAGVIIDADLSPNAFEKIKKTLPALVGAFGQFDEVGLWIYGDTFKEVHEITGLEKGNELDASVETLRSMQGTPRQPAVGSGPIDGPVIASGRPVDIRNQNINIYNNPQTAQASRPPSKVLNDVMLAAAQELSRRKPQNHRILFVVSDGRESGSRTSFTDVVKVLNSNHITVFGVDLTSAPVLGRLQKLPIPKIGGANVLSKYASATGGESFTDFSVHSIEDAYAVLTQEARNQYTLAYNSKASVLAYRDIDVRVDRPGCKQHPRDSSCVWVYAREGFWPLPPTPTQPPAASNPPPAKP